MYKSLSILTVFLLVFSVAHAQNSEDNWQKGSDGSEYNCETLQGLLTALGENDAEAIGNLGDELLFRSEDGGEISVNTYVGSMVLQSFSEDSDAAVNADELFSAGSAACSEDTTTADTNTATAVDPFPIVVNGDVNLRSCAGTTCDVLQVAANGSLLTVIGTDGDWYQVELEDGTTAFISSSLTTRGPDAIVSVDDFYTDPETGCDIAFDVKRGDMSITLILAGRRQGEIIADLYRPNEIRPLRVEGQLDKTFIDTGETYIHQYYSWNVSWPNGVYQLEFKLDDTVRKLAWELEDRGIYNVFVMCE
jgi:uncharacterized protein YgiM (DUF1202 family)